MRKEETKDKQKRKKQIYKNKPFTRIKFILYGLSFALMVYLIYIFNTVNQQPELHQYNPRLAVLEDKMIRGDILDRTGEVLASSSNIKERYYPYDDLFFHVVGYYQPIKAGLEATTNRYLLPRKSLMDYLRDQLNNQTPKGYDVITTLDVELQKLAYDALGSYKGAVVVMEPSTGKILTMVSKPSVNANIILDSDVWEDYNNDSQNPSKPLLNRASQGLYPPGSIYKVIPTLAMIQSGTWDDFTYECEGVDVYEHKRLACFDEKPHGLVNTESAFTVSCNNYFAQVGLKLGAEKMDKVSRELLFNNSLSELSFPHETSTTGLDKHASIPQIVESSIGQGKIQVTPMHMAMITSSIANGGILYKPYLVDSVVDRRVITDNTDDHIVRKYKPELYKTLMKPEDAALMDQFMGNVVSEGTGWRTNINRDDLTIHGKTGTAQNATGNDHSWFIGYSKSDGIDIVVSVVVEEGGNSSSTAVPIAKELFELHYQRTRNGE